MSNFFEGIKDWFSELKNNPNKKKIFIIGGCSIGAVVLIVLFVLYGNLHSLSLSERGASAGDLIEGNSATVERNKAGHCARTV